MIFVFSYNREKMLMEALVPISKPHIKDEIRIIDDGSSFSLVHPGFIKMAHGGKQRYWEKWQLALRIAEGSKNDFFLFMPDDFLDTNIDEIKRIHTAISHSGPYVHHIINDGRATCWNNQKPTSVSDTTQRVYFVDCGFFCNRSALSDIGWTVKPVAQGRFKAGPHISSGVGQQLTGSFLKAGVRIFRPRKSLAFHGDHPSVMHPGHRDKVKLMSI